MDSMNPYDFNDCCAWCGEVLPDGSPSTRLYCSNACKQAAYRWRKENQVEEVSKHAPWYKRWWHWILG